MRQRRIPDRFWLWLHRYAARKAQAIYVRTPKYQDNYATGVAVSRIKWENAMQRGARNTTEER